MKMTKRFLALFLAFLMAFGSFPSVVMAEGEPAPAPETVQPAPAAAEEPAPTAEPTPEPTAVPTAVPTAEPAAAPTAEPTAVPTAEPTAVPTAEPVVEVPAAAEEQPSAGGQTAAPAVDEKVDEYSSAPAPVQGPSVEPEAAPIANDEYGIMPIAQDGNLEVMLTQLSDKKDHYEVGDVLTFQIKITNHRTASSMQEIGVTYSGLSDIKNVRFDSVGERLGWETMANGWHFAHSGFDAPFVLKGLHSGESTTITFEYEIKASDVDKTLALTVSAQNGWGSHTDVTESINNIHVKRTELKVEITGETKTVTYNGTLQTADQYTVTVTNNNTGAAIDSSAVTVTFKDDYIASGTDVSTYPMKLLNNHVDVKVNNDDIYVLANHGNAVTVTNGSLTILPANVAITGPTLNMIYGDTVPTGDVKIDGLVSPDDGSALNVHVEYPAAPGFGEHELTVTYDATNKNYNVTKTDGALHVDKRPITVNVKPVDDVYVQDAGPVPVELAGTPENLVDGHALSLEAGAAGTVDTAGAGDKAITDVTATVHITDGSGAEVTDNYAVTFAGTAEVKRLLTVHYEMTGDAPKGYTAPADMSYRKGESYAVAKPDVSLYTEKDEYENVLTEYTFDGWKDAEGSYVADGKYVMGDKDVTYTGVWTKTTHPVTEYQHTLSYDWTDAPTDVPEGMELAEGSSIPALPTGGTYTRGQSYPVDSNYTNASTVEFVDAYGNVLEQYTFSGWTDPNADHKMGDGNVTISGKWEKTASHEPADYQHTVTYTYENAPEGAAALPAEKTYTQGQDYTVADAPAAVENRDGYGNLLGTWDFQGWYAEDGTLAEAGSTRKMGDANVTITGKWEYNATPMEDYTRVIGVVYHFDDEQEAHDDLGDPKFPTSVKGVIGETVGPKLEPTVVYNGKNYILDAARGPYMVEIPKDGTVTIDVYYLLDSDGDGEPDATETNDITVTVTNGTAVPAESPINVKYGGSASITFTAEEGCGLASATLDGTTIELTKNEDGTYSYTVENVTAPRAVEVKFAKLYTVTYVAKLEGTELGEAGYYEQSSQVLEGADTPAFGLDVTPYTIGEWDKTVEETVTADVTYTAILTPPDVKVTNTVDVMFTFQCSAVESHREDVNWQNNSYMQVVYGTKQYDEELGLWTATVRTNPDYVNGTQPRNNYFGNHKHYWDEDNVTVYIYWNADAKQWQPVGEQVIEVYCYTAPKAPTVDALTRQINSKTNYKLDSNKPFLFVKDYNNKGTINWKLSAADAQAIAEYIQIGEVTGNEKDGFYATMKITNIQAVIDMFNGKKGPGYVLDTEHNLYAADEYTYVLKYNDNVQTNKYGNVGFVDYGDNSKWYLDTTKTKYATPATDGGSALNGKILYVVKQYTVTYTDGVDDAVVFADQSTTVTAGSETPAFEGTPTCEGYVFTGWQPEVEPTVTDNVTYVAQWKADTDGDGEPDDEEHNVIKVTVTNGTADPAGPITVAFGADQTITFTANTGYAFESVTVDGDPAELAEDGSYTFENVTDNHTIDVVFVQLHTVTYHNGYEETVVQVKDGNTTEAPKPEREHYNFMGWAETVDGEVKYEPDADIEVNEDLDLYAVWEVKTYMQDFYAYVDGLYEDEVRSSAFKLSRTVRFDDGTEITFDKGDPKAEFGFSGSPSLAPENRTTITIKWTVELPETLIGTKPTVVGTVCSYSGNNYVIESIWKDGTSNADYGMPAPGKTSIGLVSVMLRTMTSYYKAKGGAISSTAPAWEYWKYTGKFDFGARIAEYSMPHTGPVGATATADPGYVFKGWYTCDGSGKLTSDKPVTTNVTLTAADMARFSDARKTLKSDQKFVPVFEKAEMKVKGVDKEYAYATFYPTVTFAGPDGEKLEATDLGLTVQYSENGTDGWTDEPIGVMHVKDSRTIYVRAVDMDGSVVFEPVAAGLKVTPHPITVKTQDEEYTYSGNKVWNMGTKDPESTPDKLFFEYEDLGNISYFTTPGNNYITDVDQTMQNIVHVSWRPAMGTKPGLFESDYKVTYEYGTVRLKPIKIYIGMNTTKTVPYNGEEQVFEITAANITTPARVGMGGNTVTYANGYSAKIANSDTLTADFRGTEVGEYKTLNISIMRTADNVDAYAKGDYIVEYEGGLTIEKAEAGEYTTSVSIEGWTYGDEPNAPEATVEGPGADKYGDPTYTYSVDGETWTEEVPTNAGDYTVKAAWEGNENLPELTQVATFTIMRAAVTVTADDKSIIYGDALPDLTATVDGKPEAGAAVDYTLGYTEGETPKAAGTYDIIVSEGENPNYDVTVKNGKLTIERKALLAKSHSNSTTWEYNGVAQTLHSTVFSGLVKGESPKRNWTGGQLLPGGSPNTFTLEASDTFDPNNYDITYEYGTLTVIPPSVPLQLMVEANSDTFAYDGSEHTVSGLKQTQFTLTGRRYWSKQNVKASFTVSGLDASRTESAANTYDVPVTGTATVTDEYGNDVTKYFQVDTTSGTLTIEAKRYDPDDPDSDIVMTAPEGTTYNGTAQTPAPVVKDGEKTLTEGVDYDLSYDNNTNAGTATVTVTFKGNYSGTASTSFTIGRATATVTTGSGTKVYDGTALTAAGSIVGLVNGETATVNTASVTDAGTVDNDYTITWGSADADNYTVVDGTIGTLTVTARPVTLTSGSGTKAYDGTALTNNTVTVGGQGFVGGQSAAYAFTGSQTAAGTSPNSFTYTLTGGAQARNYAITTVPGTLTVTPAPAAAMTVNAPANFVYDGAAHQWAPTVTGVGGAALTAGTDYTVTYNTADFTNAGGVTATVTGIGNYSGSVTRTYQITPRAVTLTSGSAARAYNGAALTNNTVTVGGQGFVGGQGAAYAFTGSQTAAGTSPNSFTYTLTGGAQARNYAITTVPGTLTVTPAPAAAMTVSAPVNYLYDGAAHQWAPTVTGVGGAALTAGTDYTVTYSTGDFTDAGTVTVTVTGAGNYSGSVTRTYRINRRLVILTSASATKTFDGTPLRAQEVTVGGNGFAAGEGATYNVYGQRMPTGTARNTFDYTLNAGTDADNYTIIQIYGTLTVNAAPNVPAVTQPGGDNGPDAGPADEGGNGPTDIDDNETPLGGQPADDAADGNDAADDAVDGNDAADGAETAEITEDDTPLGQAPEEDEGPDYTLSEEAIITEDDTPLGGAPVMQTVTQECCILHFILMLAALGVAIYYTHDRKKRQEREFEVRSEL